MTLVCLAFLLGCPSKEVPMASIKASTVPELVDTQETYGIPCETDLSSLHTPERMSQFSPTMQTLVIKLQRRLCFFYEELKKPPINSDQDSKNFDNKIFGPDYILPNGEKARPERNDIFNFRAALNSKPLLQKAVVQAVLHALELVFNRLYPGSNCGKNTLEVLSEMLFDPKIGLDKHKKVSEKLGKDYCQCTAIMGCRYDFIVQETLFDDLDFCIGAAAAAGTWKTYD